jgi:hypothetical protein
MAFSIWSISRSESFSAYSRMLFSAVDQASALFFNSASHAGAVGLARGFGLTDHLIDVLFGQAGGAVI